MHFRLKITPALMLIFAGVTFAENTKIPVPGTIPQFLPVVTGNSNCGPGGCGAGADWNNSQATAHLTIAPNWSWYFPDGGYTIYPGQAGSCCPSYTDYSRITWVTTPTETAQSVLNKLNSLGIPVAAPATTYLGKNPALPPDLKLTVPEGWIKEREKIMEELEKKLKEEWEKKEKERAQKEKELKEKELKKEKKDLEFKENKDDKKAKEEEKKEPDLN